MTPNRIIKDGRQWELISGPWTLAEQWLMAKHIDDFKRSGIDCITQPSPDGDLFVYRCAKGYIYEKPPSNHPRAIRSRERRLNQDLSDLEKEREWNREYMRKKRETKNSELCEK